MINLKTLAIAGGTMVLAAGAGAYMQAGGEHPVQTAQRAQATDAPAQLPVPPMPAAAQPAAQPIPGAQPDVDLAATRLPVDHAAPRPEARLDARPVQLASISLTSADLVRPDPAVAFPLPQEFPEPPVLIAATTDDIANPDTAELSEPKPADACALDLTGEPRAAAMVALRLSAPCQPNSRVSLRHEDLAVTALTDANGLLQIDVPALAEDALFIAAMEDGNAAAVELVVDTLPFYDRAVVQWQGDSGIALHAREFGAEYDTDGHVWSGMPRDATFAARGMGGFVTRLGDPGLDAPRLAEVYTFPTGTTPNAGQVELTVEIAVTDANCDRDITAQVIQLSDDLTASVSDLAMTLPGCDSVGDYLLLKNLVEDLKIAAR